MSTHYRDLDVFAFGVGFVDWLARLEGRDVPPSDADILGVATDSWPEGFGRLASALAFSVRPEGDITPDEAMTHARLVVAGAFAAWLWRDWTEATEAARS